VASILVSLGETERLKLNRQIHVSNGDVGSNMQCGWSEIQNGPNPRRNKSACQRLRSINRNGQDGQVDVRISNGLLKVLVGQHRAASEFSANKGWICVEHGNEFRPMSEEIL